MTDPQWLTWVKELQAIAQNGLTYGRDPYDRERYAALQTIAAEIAARYSQTPLPTIQKLFAQESGYATPKVDVRGVVFRDNTILLVRERSDGLWTLPGGWVDVNDAPSVAVEQEVREESGYETQAVKVRMVYDRNRHNHPPLAVHVYKLFFLCELVGGAPTHSTETDGVGFFTEEQLPPLSTTRVTAEQIARAFAHQRNPTWPTDFD